VLRLVAPVLELRLEELLLELQLVQSRAGRMPFLPKHSLHTGIEIDSN